MNCCVHTCTSQMTLPQRKLLFLFLHDKPFTAIPIWSILIREGHKLDRVNNFICRRVIYVVMWSRNVVFWSWRTMHALWLFPELVQKGHVWKVGMLMLVLMHQFVTHLQFSSGHYLFCFCSVCVWTCWLGWEGRVCGCGLPRSQLAACSDTANSSSLNVFCKCYCDNQALKANRGTRKTQTDKQNPTTTKNPSWIQTEL